MCQLNLDAYQDQVGEKYGLQERLPVYFLTELLGIAMGLGPDELQLGKHFIDPVGLLRELKLI
jgi:heterodisulfide reductase subunit B